MPVKVSGWSWLSTLFLVSMASTNSSSASFHHPWLRNVDARLLMLVKVSGCCWPSTLFLVFMACTNNSSTSFHRPLFWYIKARPVL